jgi:3-deoxy-D-manno-octulosonate 8-phosphate phosphatase (KDO 8-P phosphatase)
MSGAPSSHPVPTHGAGLPLPPRAALAAIELLLLDVDGVLTDGRIHFDHDGREYKSFHVQDAAGIVYWHRSGGLSGFVSGRGGEDVERRARELGVHEVHLKTLAKGAILRDILQRRGLQPAQVGCVGDDLLDLQILRHVGFAATVPEGRDEVKQCCHYVAARPAGFGAVRDVIELLLRARGAWAGIVAREGLP